MAGDRITIGVVMPLGTQVGGAEALLGHLLRYDRQQYRYVCVFLQDGPFVEEVRALGYDTEVFATTHLSDLKNYLSTVWRLRSWLKEKRPSLVISWMSKGHLYLGIAVLGLSAKILWFQHSVPSGTAYMDRLITMIPADGVLCCSGTSKGCQDRLFPKRPTYVCYPGVLMPESSVSKQTARQELGLPAATPIIGMVARLERWKGAYVFVEAAQWVFRQHPDAILFVIGGPHSLDPGYAEELKSTVLTMGYGSNFIMAGQRPMAETLLWQMSADVIVHPVTGVEPFGMAVVEAMAQQKVVVSSKVGGPSEIIQNGVNGILIDSGNPQLLASTLLQLVEKPELRVEIEKNAYIRGRSFSISAFVSRFDDIVHSVLTNGRLNGSEPA